METSASEKLGFSNKGQNTRHQLLTSSLFFGKKDPKTKDDLHLTRTDNLVSSLDDNRAIM